MDIIKRISGHSHPKRSRSVACSVIHTTGDTDADKIIHYYQNGDHGIGPHYLITYDGSIYQFVEEDECAYHAGYGDGQVELYQSGLDVWSKRINQEPWKLSDSYSGYETWKSRWPLESPLELVTGQHPNNASIGIELQEPVHRQPEKFFDAQYDSLVNLLKDIAGRHSFALDRNHLLGHYDVNPIARSSKDGDRDPGEAFNWDRLLTAVTQ